LLSYDGLESDYKHAIINHAVEYANGEIHANGMDIAVREIVGKRVTYAELTGKVGETETIN
jgi:hypothetical protein